MNRTDRLLAIVLELQAKKLLRAEDLAATFEVTKRTIYRDMQALSEAGVPVISLPKQGYSLVEGYFLPPLTFSTDEAIMLLLGNDFAAQTFDAEYRIAAQSANRKIEAVLPDDVRSEVEYLQANIRFIISTAPDPLETLQHLRRAIVQRRRVRFCYHARISADKSHDSQTREVDPYALAHVGGVWHLVAYCHLRQDRRHFRLDRMEDLTLLDRQFTRPANFRVQSIRKEEAPITVRALFDPKVVRWMHEARSFYQVAEEECAEGVIVTFKVHHEDQIFQWLLSWGANIEVLEPASLRDRFAEEAARMMRKHSTEDAL